MNKVCRKFTVIYSLHRYLDPLIAAFESHISIEKFEWKQIYEDELECIIELEISKFYLYVRKKCLRYPI